VLDENFSLNTAVAWTQARYQEFTDAGTTGQPYSPPIYDYATGPKNFAEQSRTATNRCWWARQDSNLGPNRYERFAIATMPLISFESD
jgi:hypothetical protein